METDGGMGKLGHEPVLRFVSERQIRNSSFQVYQTDASWRIAVALKADENVL